jgi:hypothetical protein
MSYETNQFRFPMGKAGYRAIECVFGAVHDFMRYAPNQGGDETPRENLHSAFQILRSRLNRGYSIQHAISDLERIADSFRDM